MSNLLELCGEEPEGFIKLDYSSNPDFVFENDNDFTARQLYDSDGNTVFVNSYIECEHYVSGGWGFTPIKNNEIQLQDNFTVLLLVLITLTLFAKTIFNFFRK